MKDFLNFFKSSEYYYGIMGRLQDYIAYKILNKQLYEEVKNRFYYYYKNTTSQLPIETCFQKVFRIICLNGKNPYLYDYGVSKPTQESIKDSILMLRVAFGYSTRINSTKDSHVLLNKDYESNISASSYKRMKTISEERVVTKISQSITVRSKTINYVRGIESQN